MNKAKKFRRGANHNDTSIVGGDAYFQRLRESIEGASAKRP
jgi:hypothetical protein